LRLLELGVDFNVVLEELKAQRDAIGFESFERLAGVLYEKMVGIRGILRARGLRSPGLDRFIDSVYNLPVKRK